MHTRVCVRVHTLQLMTLSEEYPAHFRMSMLPEALRNAAKLGVRDDRSMLGSHGACIPVCACVYEALRHAAKLQVQDNCSVRCFMVRACPCACVRVFEAVVAAEHHLAIFARIGPTAKVGVACGIRAAAGMDSLTARARAT